jgi:hypothetical protein
VPYRAADLPSERSEFTRPEVALIYTHLAYFGDGLSLREFKEAVQTLLSRGPSEQAFHYNRWLQQGKASGNQVAGALEPFVQLSSLFGASTPCLASRASRMLRKVTHSRLASVRVRASTCFCYCHCRSVCRLHGCL